MYAEQWAEYRNRRSMFFRVWFGGFLILIVGGILLSQVFPDKIANRGFLAISGAWMLAFMVTSIRLTYWRCPRCHNYYFVGLIVVNQLARRCRHCGLKKWDESQGE